MRRSNRLDLSASAAGWRRSTGMSNRNSASRPDSQDWQGGKRGREKGVKKRRRDVQGGGF